MSDPTPRAAEGLAEEMNRFISEVVEPWERQRYPELDDPITDRELMEDLFDGVSWTPTEQAWMIDPSSEKTSQQVEIERTKRILLRRKQKLAEIEKQLSARSSAYPYPGQPDFTDCL